MLPLYPRLTSGLPNETYHRLKEIFYRQSDEYTSTYYLVMEFFDMSLAEYLRSLADEEHLSPELLRVT